MEKLFSNHDEIVGIFYDKCTIIDPHIIAWIINNGLPYRPISRAMARMAHRCDLGDKWAAIAELPTVFHLDWGDYLKSTMGNKVIC